MTSQYFAIKQARVRKAPVDGATVVHVPAGKVVTLTGAERVEWTLGEDGVSRDARWVEISYSRWGRTYVGWSYAGFYEPVAKPAAVDPLNEVVPIPDELRTPDPFDAQQFLVLSGITHRNLCGEFCLSYLAGEPFDDYLLRAAGNPTWKILLEGNYGMGVATLAELAEDLYGFEPVRFYDGLQDPVVGTLVSPGTISKKLRDGWLLIAGVKIDGSSGRLISRGRIGHWVVLKSVQPYGVNDGQVEIYNPFSNRYETYKYHDFIASMGAFDGPLTGLWIQAPSSYAYAQAAIGELNEIGVGRSMALDQLIIDVQAFLKYERSWLEEQKKWIATQSLRIEALEDELT